MSESSPAPRWLLAGVLLNRDARWMVPHLWRGGFLAALFLAFWGASQGLSGRAAPGLALLESLTWVSAFGLVALAVLGIGNLFRDEWLGNNWDLLQITGISGFDLLLAKLIPTWLTGASFLLLEIPCFLLCVTLGGVTLMQVWAVIWQLTLLFLVASNLMVFSASMYRQTVTISIGAAVLCLLYCALGTFILDLYVTSAISPWLTPTSGAFGLSRFPASNFANEFARIFSSGFQGPVISWPTAVHMLFAGACLRWASRLIRRQLSEPREDLSLEETAPEGEAHQADLPVWRPGYKLPRIEGNAIEWKDYHFTLGGDEMMNGKWVLTVVGLIFLGFCFLTAVFRNPDAGGVLVFFGFLMFLGVIGTMAYSAKRLWVQEIREQTLPGLIMLPCGAREIVLAKLRVFVRTSKPEILLCLVFLLMILFYSAAIREWIPFALFVGLLLSIPMVVCTDAAWRFVPQTWAGFWPRTKLAGMNLLAWISSGCLGILSPMLGLILLAVLVPVMCRLAIDIAAEWLGNRGDE